MIRTTCASFALACLSACATTADLPPLEETDFIQAVALVDEQPREPTVVETVTPLPLPGQMKPVRKVTRRIVRSAASPEDTIAKGTAEARHEPSMNGYVNAVQVYPYTEGALYRVYAAPGQVSDIALQPGETLVSVSAGDTVRWVVGDTQSGSGSSARAHVLVKPISSDIATNLMIATDRRTYHLELESTTDTYMAAISWRYPQDELARRVNRTAKPPTATFREPLSALSLTDLNFDYRIDGDRPDWRPVRAFDDGAQVFIQMPDALATTDAPPLFVIGASGDIELVNYRVRGNYYIVDHLFRAAELRLGTQDQTVVRITKASPRRGLAALFGSGRHD